MLDGAQCAMAIHASDPLCASVTVEKRMGGMGPFAVPDARVGSVLAGYRLEECVGISASSWIYCGVGATNTTSTTQAASGPKVNDPNPVATGLLMVMGGTPKERTDNQKRFQVEAVCSKGLFSQRNVEATTATIGAGQGGDITLSCSGAALLTDGGGADLTTNSTQSMATEGSFPSADGKTWHFRAYNYEDHSQSHTGQVYVVCVS